MPFFFNGPTWFLRRLLVNFQGDSNYEGTYITDYRGNEEAQKTVDN
jgi:hypothetical protein